MHFKSKFHREINKENKIIDIDKIFNLKKNKDIILPLGSCFLDEFCFYLQKKKFNICNDKSKNFIINCDRQSKEKAFQFFFGNFYNPLNLLNNLERIVNKKWNFKNRDFVYSNAFDHYINLYVKTRDKIQNIKKLKYKIKTIDQDLFNEIKKSSVILLCFDSAEVWVDKYSKKAWYTFYGDFFKQKIYKNQAKLITLNAENIKITVKKIIHLLNKVGKKKKFILIGSPHPLISTYKNKDHQISNWYDKSNFISAYTDLIDKNVSYFPVNEILHNYKEKEIYENNYFYLKSRSKSKILVPNFEKLYF